jgi:hypothetical protein
MWLVTMWRLMWDIMAVPECPRCGGIGHRPSQCRWPAVIKGAPGCNGACNQGRTKCTCR